MVITTTPVMNTGDDFCAQCAKNGVVSKIKKVYIDFEETIILCDNEACLFPFFSPVNTDCNEQNSTVNSVHQFQIDETAQSFDFSYLDSVLETPVSQDGNIAEIVHQLESSEISYENVIQITDYCDFSTVLEIQKEPEIMNNSMNLDTPIYQIIQQNVVTDTQATMISTLQKVEPKTTSQVNSNASKKKQFPCFGQNSITTSTCKSKRPARQSTSQPKKLVKSKDKNPMDIFSFSKAASKPRNKRQRETKLQCIKTSLTDSLKNDSKSSLVRHWLAKQSPSKAFPGYGATCSKSLKGTSDGRSLTDSVPPSPTSIC